MALTVLDLYSGCGGLSLGFELCGAYRVLAGLDKFEWAVRSFYENHPAACRGFSLPVDIGATTGDKIVEILGERPDVVVGGPPCQGFSKAGRRTGADPRNAEVWNFQRLTCELSPSAFVMENVDGLLTTGQATRGSIVSELADRFEGHGYAMHSAILDSAHFRAPQRRKRFFLVGLKEKAHFAFPSPACGDEGPEPFCTVSDALDDLPTPLPQDPQPYGPKRPTTWLQRFLREGSHALHQHSLTAHAPEMVRRLRVLKQGTRLYPNWNHSWYRLDPERPSPAVKENHRAPFVHPAESRVVSVRECARLQTFPDRYRILGTKTAQLIQVGNAVPVLLAASVATSLAHALGCASEVTCPGGLPSRFLPFVKAPARRVVRNG
ncbi:MAG: DNA cytosine methyltransferase [Deltaproteobacteria bacterium]|nr:DNA cytosine methyltransferase [Deltaproteobacteria bacterium]